MNMHVVESSNVAAVGYDSDAKQLHVVFKKDGARWVYSGITPELSAAFMSAASIGSFLRKSIIPAATSAAKQV